MTETAKRRMNCPECLRSFSFNPIHSGKDANCPACKRPIKLEGQIKTGQPRTVDRSARVLKRRSGSFSLGSMVQWLGVLLLLPIPGVLMAPMLFIPVAFSAILGVILLMVGSRIAGGFECSDCGTRVSRPNVKTCPGCRTELQPYKDPGRLKHRTA